MAVIFESLIRQLFLTFLYAGYRHVYLEGMEEASIFVHVAVNDVTGKVGITAETSLKSCSPLPMSVCDCSGPLFYEMLNIEADNV